MLLYKDRRLNVAQFNSSNMMLLYMHKFFIYVAILYMLAKLFPSSRDISESRQSTCTMYSTCSYSRYLVPTVKKGCVPDRRGSPSHRYTLGTPGYSLLTCV